jgi:hypothetical protein
MHTREHAPPPTLPSHPPLPPSLCNEPPPPQAEINPGRNNSKDWPLQHCATRLLREVLGVLDLADRAGTRDDRHAADRLARRWAAARGRRPRR